MRSLTPVLRRRTFSQLSAGPLLLPPVRMSHEHVAMHLPPGAREVLATGLAARLACRCHFARSEYRYRTSCRPPRAAAPPRFSNSSRRHDERGHVTCESRDLDKVNGVPCAAVPKVRRATVQHRVQNRRAETETGEPLLTTQPTKRLQVRSECCIYHWYNKMLLSNTPGGRGPTP